MRALAGYRPKFIKMPELRFTYEKENSFKLAAPSKRVFSYLKRDSGIMFLGLWPTVPSRSSADNQEDILPTTYASR